MKPIYRYCGIGYQHMRGYYLSTPVKAGWYLVTYEQIYLQFKDPTIVCCLHIPLKSINNETR